MYSTGSFTSSWRPKARSCCLSPTSIGSTLRAMKLPLTCSTIFSADHTDERRRPFLEEETIKDHQATSQLKNILQLLEEIAEDNVAVVESLNRVREAQDALRSDVAREIEQLREEWT